MAMMQGIRELARELNQLRLSSADLVSAALDKARSDECAGVFTQLNESVLEQARAIDDARANGTQQSPLAGIPITLKDLFDIKGEKTLAGSVALEELVEVAEQDAKVVQPLRDSDMLVLGRVNMSEFAFSGMGMNPHFDPLYSVWDRETGRLPGGSSSGSAVSVGLGLVPATLGSDTAGSCRIPAAFNGVVGVKPSYGRLSLDGVYPLSPSSDAPGPLAVDVDSCFILDHLMSGSFTGELPPLTPRPLEGLTFLVPESKVLEDLDDEVRKAFELAIMKLAVNGVKILKQPMPVIDGAVELFLKRPVAVYEAYQHHQPLLEAKGVLYDPYVRKRLYSGSNVTKEDQRQRLEEKAILKKWFAKECEEQTIDAVVYPTVACVPPPWPETDDIDALGAINLHCLRNTAAINNVDGCSISLPCHAPGEAPAGLMLSKPHGEDQALYEIAAAVEAAINN